MNGQSIVRLVFLVVEGVATEGLDFTGWGKGKFPQLIRGRRVLTIEGRLKDLKLRPGAAERRLLRK
jgi:hypothetical protein